MNEVFSNAKTWREYHSSEMGLWSKLHHGIQHSIIAEYRHNLGLIPTSGSDQRYSTYMYIIGVNRPELGGTVPNLYATSRMILLHSRLFCTFQLEFTSDIWTFACSILLFA